jgi:hypothetical protein
MAARGTAPRGAREDAGELQLLRQEKSISLEHYITPAPSRRTSEAGPAQRARPSASAGGLAALSQQPASRPRQEQRQEQDAPFLTPAASRRSSLSSGNSAFHDAASDVLSRASRARRGSDAFHSASSSSSSGGSSADAFATPQLSRSATATAQQGAELAAAAARAAPRRAQAAGAAAGWALPVIAKEGSGEFLTPLPSRRSSFTDAGRGSSASRQGCGSWPAAAAGADGARGPAAISRAASNSFATPAGSEGGAAPQAPAAPAAAAPRAGAAAAAAVGRAPAAAAALLPAAAPAQRQARAAAVSSDGSTTEATDYSEAAEATAEAPRHTARALQQPQARPVARGPDAQQYAALLLQSQEFLDASSSLSSTAVSSSLSSTSISSSRFTSRSCTPLGSVSTFLEEDDPSPARLAWPKAAAALSSLGTSLAVSPRVSFSGLAPQEQEQGQEQDQPVQLARGRTCSKEGEDLLLFLKEQRLMVGSCTAPATCPCAGAAALWLTRSLR